MLVLAAGCSTVASTPLADRDVVPAKGRRLLVISIDGMRPDVLLRAEAPNIRKLMSQGAFTFYAESTDLAVTLPTHASMVTGLQPKDHGILINSDSAEGAEQVLTKPTFMELARKAGRTTAMVASKSKFSILDRPDSLDWKSYPGNKSDPNDKDGKKFDDARVARRAVEILREHHPEVLFVHFPGPDTVGHRDGWGSPSHVAGVAEVDRGIGAILAELDRQNLRGQTLVIVTADHGGAVKTHGGIDPRSRYIPFIAQGPGVRRNYDLTLQKGLVVHVEDTFATALEWLEIPRPEGIYGKPVWAIYEKAPKGAPPAATEPAKKPKTKKPQTAPATAAVAG
ncbi:MAG: ectonucleotide pyrophosphatase/phosphodiesterase [Phycisphaerae bacterium]